MKEAPRTLIMTSKNGQLIKDSQYLTLQIAKKKCQVLWNVWSCCLRKDNWARELVHCGDLYGFFSSVIANMGFQSYFLAE